ncbi:fasciclin domain-containing protein [Iamia sp. SCSIO 61187]|uniref:fasciclin domain-containing protein n=1 Tax=Iamia sp. SCSIO 61187 TaxID=2722752 RepID=UPI001C625DB5|nr:fasciclin domain-containing protein [Iamia sp. SCSIO 61187]QYG94873.1 fasciclin domain-containing protein [Iamia sp. SCSIO 61187]
MRTKKPFMTLLALLATLSLAAAACGDDEGSDTASGSDTETTVTEDEGTETTEADDDAMAEDDAAMAEPVGEACSAIPADGEGSSAGMADDTAGTAASNNPVLSTLVEAVVAADLVDALNAPDAEYTIFAPANSAFEAIPAEDLDALLADTDALTDVLTYHVYDGGMLDAEALSGESELTMLNGDTVELAMEGDSLTINGESTVVCANVTTANATVHIIDSVLMPPA